MLLCWYKIEGSVRSGMLDLKKFKIGLRTLKTGISVFLCMLIFTIFDRGTPIVATLTAVFALREDMNNTLKFGRHRIVGNTFGAIFAVVVILLYEWVGYIVLVQLVGIPLLIMIMITFCVATGHSEGVVGACGTFLTIIFMIPENESFGYALQRVVDTFIGTGIALGVNHFIRPKKARASSIE